MNKLSRRKSRIIAFQAIYSWDLNKESIDDILSFSWLQKDSELKDGTLKEFTESEKEEQTFASFIITGTIDHIAEIDELIKSHLSSSWCIERVNKVTLAILRTGIYEMIFQAGSESKIVIDEAIGIAKDYGPEDSFKFVNAVLDKINKDAKS